jgi:hypothetical protein
VRDDRGEKHSAGGNGFSIARSSSGTYFQLNFSLFGQLVSWLDIVLMYLQSAASVEPATQEAGAEGSGEWSGDAIRRRFLDFYAARGHKILPSSSLVPDDPTVFLTIAGMLQFKPIFLGKVCLVNRVQQRHVCFEVYVASRIAPRSHLDQSRCTSLAVQFSTQKKHR